MSEENRLQYLIPTFEVGVSLNGHYEEFLLSPTFYLHLAQDGDVDPFSFTAIWLYISKHIHEYLFAFDITKDTGPVDTDNLKLVSLNINVQVSPGEFKRVIDCDECIDRYTEQITKNIPNNEEDEDD